MKRLVRWFKFKIGCIDWCEYTHPNDTHWGWEQKVIAKDSHALDKFYGVKK